MEKCEGYFKCFSDTFLFLVMSPLLLLTFVTTTINKEVTPVILDVFIVFIVLSFLLSLSPSSPLPTLLSILHDTQRAFPARRPGGKVFAKQGIEPS